ADNRPHTTCLRSQSQIAREDREKRDAQSRHNLRWPAALENKRSLGVHIDEKVGLVAEREHELFERRAFVAVNSMGCPRSSCRAGIAPTMRAGIPVMRCMTYN